MRARAQHRRRYLAALAAAWALSSSVASAQANGPHLEGFGFDAQLVGGGGIGFGGKLGNYFLGRARVGALYVDEPWIANAGLTFEVGALAGFGAGAEIEFNTWRGFSAQLGLEHVDDRRWMTHVAVGYTVISLEWQHRFSDASPTDALLLEVRLPFGIWWFLKRSKSAESTVATVRRAEPPRPIPPPPAPIPSVPTRSAPASPSPPPPAEPPPPSAASDDAAELLAEAERDRAAGHDGEAIAVYERAYALHPDPAILWSLARTEIARGWLTAALDPLRRIIAAAPTPEARADAQRAMSELQQRLAHLRLELIHGHGDERVEIDGKLEPGAGLGYDVVLDPGDHVLTISRGDRTLDRRSFHAGEAELVRLSVELKTSDQ